MTEELANLFIEHEKREWYYNKPFRAKHRYIEYDLVAISLNKLCKKDNYKAVFYFKKPDGSNISGFTITMVLNSLNGKMKHYIETVILNDPEFVCLKVNGLKYSENILNKKVFEELDLKLRTYPYSELFEVSNNSFSLKLDFEDIPNYFPYMKNLRLDANVLRENVKELDQLDKALDTKIKKLKLEIETLKKNKEEIKEKKARFEKNVEIIKEIIGEDEFATQALIFEFTKGSFK